jgi:hypothetical protein
MDDFDRLLELQLRRKLDPLVTAPVPARRGWLGSGHRLKRRGTEISTSRRGNSDLGVLVLPY